MIEQYMWHKDADGHPVRLTIPHKETNPRKVCSFPNPFYREEATWSARYRIRQLISDKELVSDLYQVLAMAEAYQDLTANVLGQEHSVRRLRDIWRARRALDATGEREG